MGWPDSRTCVRSGLAAELLAPVAIRSGPFSGCGARAVLSIFIPAQFLKMTSAPGDSLPPSCTQLYAEELVAPLLETMQQMSQPESLVAIAIYNRDARAYAKFWELLPNYFARWEKVPEARFGSPPQPDDIGIFQLYH